MAGFDRSKSYLGSNLFLLGTMYDVVQDALKDAMEVQDR